MKYFVLFSIFISSPVLASDYTLNAFYPTAGFVTEKLLPFSVQAKDSGEFTILNVTTDKPCHSMVDPHREKIVLIYCTEAMETSFKLTLLKDGKKYEVSSPEITVKKVALISSSPSDPVDKDPFALGRQKFSVNCKKCHQLPYAIEKGVTKTTLTNAFSGKPLRFGRPATLSMKAFEGSFFSDKELQALVDYINGELAK